MKGKEYFQEYVVSSLIVQLLQMVRSLTKTAQEEYTKGSTSAFEGISLALWQTGR
jgi:hypothetical protein